MNWLIKHPKPEPGPPGPCPFRNRLFQARRTLILLVATLTGVIHLGCENYRVTDQGEQLYRKNWWNYYERGLRRLGRGEIGAAKNDFERCLGLRERKRFAFPRDSWFVRTYGMHFLNGYYPHRELGICYFLEGDYVGAAPLLERSLEQAPSGRAKAYLNRVHREQLRGAHLAPPEILIDDASRHLWTRDRSRPLNGWVKGEGYVSEIRVNGNREFIELAETKRRLQPHLRLRPGTNVIVIEARDLLGNETVDTLSWIADWQPPQCLIQRVTPSESESKTLNAFQSGSTNAWVVELLCVDDFALDQISIDEKNLPIPSSPSNTHQHRFTLRVEGPKPRTIAVRDRAGNELKAHFSTSQLTRNFSALLNRRYTSNQEMGVTDSLVNETPLPAGPSPQLSRGDRLPPDLEISENSKVPIIYTKDYFLNGSADDKGGLASVMVKGENLLDSHRGSQGSRFSRHFTLNMGTNVILVTAEDLAGNRTEAELVIVCKRPPQLNPENRLRVTVSTKTECKGGEPELLSQLLEEALVRPPERFNVLVRDCKGFLEILREQGLSASKITDPRAAIEIRKLLPAELVFMCYVFDAPTNGEKSLAVRFMDTSKGEVLGREDVYFEMAHNTTHQLDGLAKKIKQRFPLLEGRVVGVSRQGVQLNVGKEDGVTKSTSFMVLNGKPSADLLSPVRAHRVGATLVQLSYSRANEHECMTHILPPTAIGRIKKGDYVYTR